MFFKKYKGQYIWTSLEKLSLSQRWLLWWSVRDKLITRILVVAVLVMPVSTVGLFVTLGLHNEALLSGFGVLVIVAVFGTIASDEIRRGIDELRNNDKRFRFEEMQVKTPAFRLAWYYCHGALVWDGYDIEDEVPQTTGSREHDAVIAKWLERQWYTDHLSTIRLSDEGDVAYAEYRLTTTEEAVATFKRLGLPQMDRFDAVCEEAIAKARRRLAKAVRRERSQLHKQIEWADKRLVSLELWLDELEPEREAASAKSPPL